MSKPTLFETILCQRFSRRDALKVTAATAIVGLESPLAAFENPDFHFDGVASGISESHVVSAHHETHVLLRWGDALFPDSPVFSPREQNATSQLKQFGYNNDFIGYHSIGPSRGIICVNHEYTQPRLMFPDVQVNAQGHVISETMTAEHCAIEQAAIGGSIVEVERHKDSWRLVINSPYNRRISVSDTVFAVGGPARGHDRLKTSADPEGIYIRGTLGNCAGGMTAWGTYLSAEENIDDFFSGQLPAGHVEAQNHAMMGVPGNGYQWYRFDKRFDIGTEPNEPNRFGWIVEIDIFDRNSTPVKRTALGRFKHEGAETIIAPDGRMVVYMGDDEAFECIYRFISRDKVNLIDRQANANLLDDGILYVARFESDGRLIWLPLIYGQSPLDADNGFNSQADVLIETRRAARLLGATLMDRPEGVKPHPSNGFVYVNLTNNLERKADQADAANPRGPNAYGHIVELKAPAGNHCAEIFEWNMLLLCDPTQKEVQPNKGVSASAMNCPDNAAFDHRGRLWVATDQGSKWHKSQSADGFWAVETQGPHRGKSKMLFRVPVGAEVAGPCFTPDGRSLFLSVQHPGADGADDFTGFARPSTYHDPVTRWPDFKLDMPPRPSVVVIRRQDGGVIG